MKKARFDGSSALKCQAEKALSGGSPREPVVKPGHVCGVPFNLKALMRFVDPYARCGSGLPYLALDLGVEIARHRVCKGATVGEGPTFVFQLEHGVQPFGGKGSLP